MKLQFVAIAIALLFLSTASIAQKKDKGQNNPPPAEQADTTSTAFDFGSMMDSSGFNFGSMFSGMMPMYKSMASQMMEGAMQFYEQPGMVNRIATLNKKYYDALKQAGFTDDQAMKILVSSPLSIGMTGGKQ